MTERQEYWYEFAAVVLMCIGIMVVFLAAFKAVSWVIS